MNLLKLFILCLYLLCFSKELAASDMLAVGKITLSKGEVTVLRLGMLERVYLLVGDFVYENDHIETASYSVMKIKFIKNGNLILGPNSEIKIKKFKKRRSGFIKLLKGQLRSQVKKAKDSELTLKEKFS